MYWISLILFYVDDFIKAEPRLQSGPRIELEKKNSQRHQSFRLDVSENGRMTVGLPG